jgi:glycine betaine catabolism B
MKSKFIEKVQETPTDWSFRFTQPEGYTYLAGQFSVIRVTPKYDDYRNNVRTCSTSSSPTEEFVQFTFTIRDTGFKRTLMELQEGDEVDITPAKGKMTLEAAGPGNIIMIAGGIGVAPYRGMAKFACDTQKDDVQLTLLYSDKTIEELCYKKEFDEIEAKYKNFKVVYTLTRHQSDHGEWLGREGRINVDFIQEHISVDPAPIYMVCGPVDMVQSTLSHLEMLSIPREQIISELFTGY